MSSHKSPPCVSDLSGARHLKCAKSLSVPARLLAHATHTDCIRWFGMHTFCPRNAHGLHLAPHRFDGNSLLGPTFRNVVPFSSPACTRFVLGTQSPRPVCTRCVPGILI